VKRDDLIAGVLLALIGLAVVAGAIRLHVGTPIHPQPGFFPFVGGGALILLAVVLLIQAWLGWSTGSEAFGNVGGPAILVVSMGGYVAILDPLGYVLATLLLAVVILRVLKVRSWRVLALSSVALSVGTYLLFARVLGIELPAGILEFLG
jgi:putative tricarboxylic transport membrane protein